MTSGNTFPNRFTKVDELTRSDHWHLTADDKCFFIGEYTARKGYAYSETNQLIFNFKKTMDRRNRPEWKYKDQAIQHVAGVLRNALNEATLNRLTFVPVPPSKARDDPLYDNRLTQMLHVIRPTPRLDIREILVQRISTDSVHNIEVRPNPGQIKQLYRLDEELTEPAPGLIAIVDDVLVTGAHFKAAQSALSDRFPGTSIVGLFIARRVPETSDIEDIEFL